METVIYLTTTGIEVLSGEYKNQNLQISDYNIYELPAGSMINGVIINKEAIKPVLEEVAKTVSKAKLVISTSQLLRKILNTPKLTHEEMIDLIKYELKQPGAEESSDEMVYDYAIIDEKPEGKEGIEVLAVAIPKEFIAKYIELFGEAKIELTGIDASYNALHKLFDSVAELKDKVFIIANLRGSDIAVSLYKGKNEIFVQNSRIFSEAGTPNYINEINSIILKMINFNLANYREYEVSDIYFCNVDNLEKEILFNVVKSSTETNVEKFIKPAMVDYTGSKGQFPVDKFLYCLGTLIRR